MLFHESIGHNIAYGDLNAPQSEVEAAAKAARIHDTITTRFADGYETRVGERGLMISGTLCNIWVPSC